MNKHRIKSFLSNINYILIKKFTLMILLFVLILSFLFITPKIIFAQNNSNSNEESEESNEETSEESEESNEESSESSEEETSQQQDTNEFERTIEYDETITEADKNLYKKWEKDIEFGVSEKKLKIIKHIVEMKKLYFLPLLIKILEKEMNQDVIVATINACLRLQYFEASDTIAQYLDSDNKSILTVTIKTLGTFKYQPLADHLEDLLDTENKSLKDAVIFAIGSLKLDYLTTDLIDMYYDTEVEEANKETIIKALSLIGNEEAMELLIEIYEDETVTNAQRAYALRGLIFNKYGDVNEYLKKAVESKNAVLKAESLVSLLTFEPEDIPMDIIYACLKDDGKGIRIRALQVISKQKLYDEQIDEFLKYIIKNDPDKHVKYFAVGVYLTVAESEAISYIEERISQGDEEVKHAVIGLLHLLPADKAIEYAKEELSQKGQSLKEFESFLTSIRNIKDNAGLSLLIDMAKNPMDYEAVKSDIRYYAQVIKELTKFEQNEEVHQTFLYLIKHSEKKSLYAVELYPDLYTDDMVPVMIEIILGDEYGLSMKVRAIKNIILFGEKEDHLKLKKIYDDPNTSDDIKKRIKAMFNQVGINVELIGVNDDDSNEESDGEGDSSESNNDGG